MFILYSNWLITSQEARGAALLLGKVLTVSQLQPSERNIAVLLGRMKVKLFCAVFDMLVMMLFQMCDLRKAFFHVLYDQ